jgi:hydroxymethylpyrimidine/phosphomethylpyrimidine kinase
VAGFDPSGGAGILADAKAFETLGCYGLGVVSALTWQNELCFSGLKWVDVTDMEQQLKPLAHFNVKAAKIGLIESVERVMEVASLLKATYPGVFVVWDPILKASAGFAFHEGMTISDKLNGVVDLITPNALEFEQLGFNEHLPGCAVLLKGGHRTQKCGVDTLYFKGEMIDIEGEPFTRKADKHGTGCVLSAAIVAYLSQGNALVTSCTLAKRYVEAFIQSNTGKLGYHTAN